MTSIDEFLSITNLLFNIIAALSVIVTSVTFFVINRATPKKSRLYAKFLIVIETSSLFAVLSWVWLAPNFMLQTSHGPIICYSKSFYVFSAMLIDEHFNLGKLFPQKFAVFATIAAQIVTIFAYSHALFYRHQLAIPSNSRFRLKPWQIKVTFGLAYALAILFTIKAMQIEEIDLTQLSINLSEMACAGVGNLHDVAVIINIVLVCVLLLLLFLVLHANYSIRNHTTMHKRVKEISLVLLYSMSAQMLIYVIFIFIPFSIVIFLWHSDILTTAWTFAIMSMCLTNIISSSITIFTSAVYRKYLLLFFSKSKPSSTSTVVIGSAAYRQRISIPTARRNTVFYYIRNQ